ncbi:hypothetical protein C5167_012070 [Papaver somniferum]|uniref:Uncharacterized protein n=1 Tax=Papaver somniferum TaxID=3469 RepID=A0A4Y7J0N5_PAPSO|nr:hypothetical protein C5167_012070 [Papaver somniferum]
MISSSSSSSPSWFSGFVRSRSSVKPENPSNMMTTDAIASEGGGILSGGSVNRKNHGFLFKYGPKSAQVAFKTGDFKQQVIFIGGLTDGLLATDYVEPLSIALQKEKWSLVQPLLSSSYTGYGTSSLKQDIVHYLRTNAACSRAVRAAILQAPVSDREFRATLPETAEMIDLASTMISEGRGDELMPLRANPDAPISAYR